MPILTSGKSSPWPTVILVLVTAGLTLLLSNKISTCNRATPTGHAPDSVIYSINKVGDTIASLRGAMEDFGIQNKRIADSIAKVYGAKLKELREYVIATLKTQAEVPIVDGSQHWEYMPPTIINGDTCPPQVRNISGTFESGYYHADAQLGEEPYLKVIGYDTLTVIWRDTTIGRFFNKKKYLQLDVSLANPDTRVTGIKAYRLPLPAPKRWAIGFTGGYGWHVDPKTAKVSAGPYIGIGLTRTLIRF